MEKKHSPLTCYYEKDKHMWENLTQQFKQELDQLQSLSNKADDKLSDSIKELERTFKTSLGFLEEVVRKEMNRNDELENALKDVERWRAEIQELIADLTVQLEQRNNSNFEQLSQLLMENMKSMRRIIEKSFQVQEKKTIDWTKVILAMVSTGSVIGIIIQKLLGGLS